MLGRGNPVGNIGGVVWCVEWVEMEEEAAQRASHTLTLELDHFPERKRCTPDPKSEPVSPGGAF